MNSWEIMKVLKEIDKDGGDGFGEREYRDRELEEAYRCGREDMMKELMSRFGGNFGMRDDMGGNYGSNGGNNGNYGGGYSGGPGEGGGYGDRRGVPGTGPYARRYRR